MKPRINRPFEIKATKEDGSFEGIASPFGNVDGGGDIVMPGAFSKSLAEFEAKNRRVPMLWQHNPRQPIGVYTSLKETNVALTVEGQCNMEVQQGRECHALMKQGALTGLSIGYDPIVVQWDAAQEVRSLIEVDLWEISPVTFPMNDDARVTLVKSLAEAGSLSDCEALLRDAGYSKSEATAFVSRCAALAKRGDPDAAMAESVKRAFAILNNT